MLDLFILHLEQGRIVEVECVGRVCNSVQHFFFTTKAELC